MIREVKIMEGKIRVKDHNSRRKCLAITCLIFIVALFSKELLAAPYYGGKKITIVVGVGPGGGHDRMARLLAKHLSKYIEGKPIILVENMPGAASIIGANHIYHIAKPDGLTIGTFERGIPIAQLLKLEGVKYDVRKYSWIGSMAVEPSLLAIRADLPFKTYQDVLKSKSPIMFGITGAADAFAQFISLLKEFHGLTCRVVTYPSSADVQLAVDRKEVDGRGYSLNAFRPFMDRGDMRPIIRGRVSGPEIENLPVDEDLTTDKLGKTLMAIRSLPEQIGRPYVAPPGTSAVALKALRDGFLNVSKDPQFQEESKKLMMKVDYTPPEQCMKVSDYILNQPEDIVREFRKYHKF